MIPSDLRYHKEHEWVRLSGTQATVGISHFAQDALGDIVFLDLPKVGAVVKAGDGGSDLPDQGVVQCVVRGIANLSFPQPEKGEVQVVYPLIYAPPSTAG